MLMMNHHTKKYRKSGRNGSVWSVSGAGRRTNAKRTIVLRLFAAVCLLSVLVPALLYAASVVGTAGNDVLSFQGNGELLTTTLTNAYTGETIFINDFYNVNTATYDGMGGTDTLLMTNVGDAIFALDASNQQTLVSVESIVAGDGSDIIDLASTQVTLGNVNINGGAGDDIIWGNAGNDTIQGLDGNDRIDGGPGNDVISGGNGNDILDGGAGSDTVTGDSGSDTFIYSQTQNIGYTDTYGGGTGQDTLTLKLTAAQANADAADIAAAQAFITANYNLTASTGPSYTFSSFSLTFSTIEALNMVITSNTPPVAQEDDFTGTNNQAITGNVLADNGHGADSDADGDALSVQPATITTGAGGNVTLNADGSFTYTNTGYVGADSFTYTLLDTHGGSATGTVNLTLTASGPAYAAQITQPINFDGSSVFSSKRGTIPVKFTLTADGVSTCNLPPATISLFRIGTSSSTQINESNYVGSADTGSNFRISSCQYIYNLGSKTLGSGTYEVVISINSTMVGSGLFGIN